MITAGVVEFKKPIAFMEQVSRCSNILILELARSQVLVNIAQVQNKSRLPRTVHCNPKRVADPQISTQNFHNGT